MRCAAYLANNDPRMTIQAEGRQLVETFAKRLQAQRKAGQASEPAGGAGVPLSEVEHEGGGRPALGGRVCMDALDRQRQRILVSFLDEFQSE